MMPTASAMFVLGTETAEQIDTGDTLAILSSPLADRPLAASMTPLRGKPRTTVSVR